jgi:hypothetical protein
VSRLLKSKAKKVFTDIIGYLWYARPDIWYVPTSVDQCPELFIHFDLFKSRARGTDTTNNGKHKALPPFIFHKWR